MEKNRVSLFNQSITQLIWCPENRNACCVSYCRNARLGCGMGYWRGIVALTQNGVWGNLETCVFNVSGPAEDNLSVPLVS